MSAKKKQIWVALKNLPRQKVASEGIVYWEIRDGHVWHQRRRLRRADPESFEVRRDEHQFLGRDREQVFHAWTRLGGVDRDTFEVLADGYCRDKRMAYFEHEASLAPLKGRTVKQFAVLGNGYARDASHGYLWGKPLRGCVAPQTLEIVRARRNDTASLYARDEEHVYFEGAALNGADVGEWRPLEKGYSTDSRSVFYCGKKLPRAQPESWKHLGHMYSRDDANVYWMSFRLEGAHASTFTVTRDGKARDKTGAFDRKRRVS